MMRTDVDYEVSPFEMSTKPLDLQSIKPIHAVWGVEISAIEWDENPVHTVTYARRSDKVPRFGHRGFALI